MDRWYKSRYRYNWEEYQRSRYCCFGRKFHHAETAVVAAVRRSGNHHRIVVVAVSVDVEVTVSVDYGVQKFLILEPSMSRKRNRDRAKVYTFDLGPLM